MFYTHRALLATNSIRNKQFYTVQVAYSACTVNLFVSTCKMERERERERNREGRKEGVCFVPRKVLLSYTYNKSIANKTTTFKQICLTPTLLLAHTHTQLQTPTHSFTYTIKILIQQDFLFVTICAWRTNSNEAEEEGYERKGVFLLMEDHSSVSSLCRWTLLLHQWPHAQ